MRTKIEQVLDGLPVHKIEKIGPFWQISLGSLSGARENGLALARDLRSQWERLEGVTQRSDPEDAKAAIMRGLGKIEETGAKLKERPEAPEPEPEEVVPDEVKQALKEAGIDWRDSREAVSNALIAKYRYYKGAAEYARTNGTFDGRGVIYWEKKAEGIDDATAWNRARTVEAV